MDEKKKGRVGLFEVWHIGPRAYEVRRAGETLRTAENINAAYRAAEYLDRAHRFASAAANEIERGE
jgi:hypothetical protein